MNLAQEVFLTPRVTHVVRDRAAPRVASRPRCVRRDAGRSRADAMLERVRIEFRHANYEPHTNYVLLSPEKAIILLDKLYDTFFRAPRKTKVRLFNKHFIKIEFLDKPCRPVYKEFDEWPVVAVEPDPREKEDEKQLPEDPDTNIANCIDTNKEGQKMTRKSRPRIKEREEKVQKKGYCEMCNTDYLDAAIHRRSPHHLAFVKDHTNFLALDSLIGAEADVTTFLDKATPLNGERRSLRKICNGEVEQPKTKRSKRSQSPDSTVNGSQSPKRNGGLEDEKKHNTRCSKRGSDSQLSEDRQYYKVVGVSTKLRSSGGFTTKRKDSPPMCNGAKPLVVKFRKVRRSELSVLSDEAEQFMFPKRASSTSSTSSDEDEKEIINTRRKSPPQPPPSLERRRLARPIALKEESSEEDSWPEDKRRRKRRGPPVVKRARRAPCRTSVVPPLTTSIEPLEITPQVAEEPKPEGEISPLREEPVEKCMKWEDGKLKYTAVVEQLEFAFETVPHSEPWFETFKRQDQDKAVTKNVPRYFSLYSKSPKLPYELGQLPPLKPNCCPLSDLVKREDKPGPSRLYGTRGMKKQKIRRRTAAILALEGHPRKSPREHASTLAILGSAGLLHRRKHAEDAKSTASEDTVSDVHSNTKVDPVLSETQEASERLQQFLSEVFEDASEFDMSDEIIDGEAAVTTSTNVPDVLSLVSECEDCDIIRKEIKENTVDKVRGRRGKFKKKNRTGWPNKKKHVKKGSRANSTETEHKTDSLDRSSAELADDDTTQDMVSEEDTNLSETENDTTLIEVKPNTDEDSQDICDMHIGGTEIKEDKKEDKPLHLDVNILLHNKGEKESPKSEPEKDDKRTSRSSASETEEMQEKGRKRKRVVQNLGDWLQPIVRVTRVDPNASRRLRSSGRARGSRYR